MDPFSSAAKSPRETDTAVSSPKAGTPAARVLIADDHAPIRIGVRSALEAADMVVVADVATGRAAVECALACKPDLALLDIHMPDGGGIYAAAEIRRLLPGVVVVMLTDSPDDEDLFASLRAGAAGFLIKNIDLDTLPKAIRGALQGEAAMPRDLMARVLETFRSSPHSAQDRFRSPAAAKLTPREREVMELLAGGLSTEAVAARMSLSPQTVRVHVSNTLKKLGTRDRKDALTVLLGEHSPGHEQRLAGAG